MIRFRNSAYPVSFRLGTCPPVRFKLGISQRLKHTHTHTCELFVNCYHKPEAVGSKYQRSTSFDIKYNFQEPNQLENRAKVGSVCPDGRSVPSFQHSVHHITICHLDRTVRSPPVLFLSPALVGGGRNVLYVICSTADLVCMNQSC